jgi:hypothetical protein
MFPIGEQVQLLWLCLLEMVARHSVELFGKEEVTPACQVSQQVRLRSVALAVLVVVPTCTCCVMDVTGRKRSSLWLQSASGCE